MSVPFNAFGIQLAYSGDAISHILIDNFSGFFYHEYISNELAEPLEKDVAYEVVYRISLADYSTHGMDRIGVLFTNTKPFYPTFARIEETPQLATPKGFVLADTANWVEIRDTFVAAGSERYLTIGQFYPNDSLSFIYLPSPALSWASYYIDAVEVNAIQENPDFLAPILPNVFSPNQDGTNDFYSIENLPENSTLEIYNRWGALVFAQTPYQNNWAGNAANGQPVADGVYFVLLHYQNNLGAGQQKKQTVHVVR